MDNYRTIQGKKTNNLTGLSHQNFSPANTQNYQKSSMKINPFFIENNKSRSFNPNNLKININQNSMNMNLNMNQNNMNMNLNQNHGNDLNYMNRKNMKYNGIFPNSMEINNDMNINSNCGNQTSNISAFSQNPNDQKYVIRDKMNNNFNMNNNINQNNNAMNNMNNIIEPNNNNNNNFNIGMDMNMNNPNNNINNMMNNNNNNMNINNMGNNMMNNSGMINNNMNINNVNNMNNNNIMNISNANINNIMSNSMNMNNANNSKMMNNSKIMNNMNNNNMNISNVNNNFNNMNVNNNNINMTNMNINNMNNANNNINNNNMNNFNMFNNMGENNMNIDNMNMLNNNNNMNPQNNMNNPNPNINDVNININNDNNNDQNQLNKICDTHVLKNSMYYEYKESEATLHINQLLKDMDSFGEIVKNKIEQEKVANPNKFISLDEALSYNVQNNNFGNNNFGNNMINFGFGGFNNNNSDPQKDYYVCGIIKLALESQGCTCEIERDYAQGSEQKEIFTAMQFITNGMYKFKKYIFTFDFGDEKNNVMFNDLIARDNFNKRFKYTLKKLLNLDPKDIVISDPRKGPYKISAIIKQSNFKELTGEQLFNSLKQNMDYTGIQKVEKTILLNGCKLNRVMLDPLGDRSTGWGIGEMRGGKPYRPPESWIGYGLKVFDRYDGGNNDWIDYNNNPGEWAVAYHSMGASLSGDIKNNNNNSQLINMYNNLQETITRQKYKNAIDEYNKSKVVGEGVYMTPNPEIMENYCSIYSYQGKKYKIGIMCRIMPKKIRCPDANDTYWVINGTDNEVRPYRILIKEVF